MKKLLLFLLATPLMAALSVPLTVEELLYPGDQTGTTISARGGVARTNEPFCVGVPIPDNAAITSTSVLDWSNHTTVPAGQFRILGNWPSGHAKWVQACGILNTLSAGALGSVTLTDGGSGNYGGSNIGTDNGTTFTAATGTATFTIKKANFNVIDVAQVGATTVVSTGASAGLVVVGPSNPSSYPDNVTCGSGSGQSPCTNAYLSSNDAGSTCAVDASQNGPVMLVLKCTGQFKDASSNPYMRYVVREYFYKNKNYVRLWTQMRNADYSATANFTSAFKGMSAFELRLVPTYANANPLTYNISADSTVNSGTCLSAVCNGTLTQNGTDYAYVYQGQSNKMTFTGKPSNAPTNFYTTDLGYAIQNNATTQTSTTSTAVAVGGWADIADSTGRGVEIGVQQLSGSSPKSLEFEGGGTDVRIGIWPSENGAPTAGPGNGTIFHYQPWSSAYSTNLYLNFHTSALTTTAASNAMLSFQHYLAAHADYTWYNSSGVFPFVLENPTAEDNFYSGLTSTTKPHFTLNYSNRDLGVDGSSNYAVNSYPYYSWGAPGGGNQMEFHWSRLLNFIRRDHGGEYVDAAQFYQFFADQGMVFLDGDSWKNHSNTSELTTDGNPTLLSNVSVQNYTKVYTSAPNGFPNSVVDNEHRHAYGVTDYYFMTGDESVKDFISTGVTDYYTNPWGILGNTNGLRPNNAQYINARTTGEYFMWAARLYLYYGAIADSTSQTALVTQLGNVYSGQLQPDLCASGFPVGCTVVAPNGASGVANASGVSRARGMVYGTYQNRRTPEADTVGTCSHLFSPGRIDTAFQNSILLEGIYEWYQANTSWANRQQIWDLGYGISQFNLTEDWQDDGTGSWKSVYNRYYIQLDDANNVPFGCALNPYNYYQPQKQRDTLWMSFFYQNAYNGSVTAWKRKFIAQEQLNMSSGNDADTGHFVAGAVINILCGQSSTGCSGSTTASNPPSQSLITIPQTTGFTVSGPVGGNYTVTISAMPVYGATSFRMKYANDSSHTLVEWIGFCPGTNTWCNASASPPRTPANYQNWFAGNEITGLPAPAAGGASQGFTIPVASVGGISNLTTANFMLKAWASPPTNTFFQVKTHGVPAGNPAFESLKYNPDLDLHVSWGNYHYAASEINNALLTYDFETNYWALLGLGEPIPDFHFPENGHQNGQYLTYNTLDMLHEGGCCGSGSNGQVQRYVTWGYDLGGQLGFEKITGTHPGRPTEPTSVFDSADSLYIWCCAGQGTWTYDWSGASTGTANNWVHKSPTKNVQGGGTFLAAFDSLGGTASAYNPDDHCAYWFFGDASSVWYNNVFRYCYGAAGGTNTWTQLTPTGGPPSVRAWSGCAYSTKDKIFLCLGGKNAAASDSTTNRITDLWAFDPTANTWTQLTPIGEPTNTWHPPFEHLSYDASHNAFIFTNSPAPNTTPFVDAPSFVGSNPINTYIYCYSTPCTMPGVTELVATSPEQSVPPVNSPNLPSRNHFPQTGILSSDLGGWAMAPSIAVNGTDLYTANSELGPPFLASSAAQSAVPYMQHFTVAGGWVKMGADFSAVINGACASGGQSFWYSPQVAFAGSQLWVTYYGSRSSGSVKEAYAQQWNGSTNWNPNCATSPALLATLGGTSVTKTQIFDVGGTAYMIDLEPLSSGTFTFLFARHWNGSAWVQDGTSAGIQNNASSVVLSAYGFSDGSHPCVVWDEYTESNNFGNATVTQVYMSCFVGGVWTVQGGGAANKNTSNWATNPSATLMGSTVYIAWTERTNGGFNQLYCRSLTGGVWTDVGAGASINKDTTNGWSFAPSIFNDGTNLYVAWTEGTYQHNAVTNEALQFRGQGYVSKYPVGGPWTLQGSVFNADRIYGSVQSVRGVFFNGKPVVVATEVNFNGPQQMFDRTFDGTNWVGLTPTAFNVTAAGLPDWTINGPSYNQCVMGWATGGTAPYTTWAVATGALPTGMGINASTACITGVPTVSGLFTFTISAQDSATPTPATDTSGSATININVANSITTASLPNGTTTIAYSQTLANTGGTSSYTWSISAGSLPTGLTMDVNGNITGTPTVAGTYNFTAQVTDSVGATATKALSIQIVASCNPPVITSTSPITAATQSSSYTYTFTATGDATITWSATGVPAGLSLSSAGILSGTPTTAGTYSLQVTATNSCGSQGPTAFTLIVSPVDRSPHKHGPHRGIPGTNVH